jgi:GNAT superfamily N-acetyltransferase
MTTPERDEHDPTPRPRPRPNGDDRGYNYRVFDVADAPPVEDLVALSRGAWGADYDAIEKAYFLYDASYVRWLLPADGMSLGAWATAPDGTPAGSVLGVTRELYSRGRRFVACYGTMLSVAREHRGAGIGVGVMQRSFEAMKARGVDLYLGTFDADQAGRPVIIKAMERYDSDFRICESPPMTFWACMTELDQIDRYEPFQGVERAALLPGVREALRFHPTARDLRAPARRMPLAEVYREPRRDLSWVIGPGLSTPRMYGDHDPSESGTFAFEFGVGERCFIAYHNTTLVRVGRPPRRVGNVQLIHAGTASRVSVIRALRYVNAWLLDTGCIVTLCLDTGIVPKSSLIAAGFLPTPRKVRLFALGPRANVEALQPLALPYFSDVY